MRQRWGVARSPRHAVAARSVDEVSRRALERSLVDWRRRHVSMDPSESVERRTLIDDALEPVLEGCRSSRQAEARVPGAVLRFDDCQTLERSKE